MELEKQVCTLEQAKRLAELGVNVSPAFYHIVFSADEVRIGMECSKGAVYIDYDGEVYTTDAKEYYPAYTVAELGVMWQMEHISCTTFKFHDEWRVSWHKQQTGFQPLVVTGCSNEAEARAAMLIYLLGNNLTTAEEVNQRLLNA